MWAHRSRAVFVCALGCLGASVPPGTSAGTPLYTSELADPVLPPELDVLPSSIWVHVAEARDLDGDGRTDLILGLERGISEWPNRAYDLVVYHQEPTGDLGPPAVYTARERIESVAVGDLDGDGRPDIAIPDGYNVAIYRQQSDGLFAEPLRLATERIPERVLAGDFDADGRTDLALVPWGEDYVEILHQRPAAPFERSRVTIDHYGYEASAAGDLDGDGLADLAIVSGQGFLEGVRIVLQDGRGGFQEQRHVQLSVDDLHAAVAIGDVDGDGRGDLAVGSAYGRGEVGPYVAILRQQADGSFAETLLEGREFRGLGALELVDLNQDGKDDLLVLTSSSLLVCPTGGNGVPGPCMGYTSADWLNAHDPEALALGDLDSNGRLDIVAAAEFRGLMTLTHEADGEQVARLAGPEDFTFYTRIADPSGDEREGIQEPVCIAETACVSGAVAGRSEVFLRVVGPKPNGYLWPTLVKFTTSEVDVWAVQEATRRTKHYRLAGSRPGDDRLIGLFDAHGFAPVPMAETLDVLPKVDPPQPPPGDFLTSPEVPGFRFKVQIHGADGLQPVRAEPACIPETLCVSGAIAGRSELFVRIVGPKPNGYLWPTLVRFSTSEIEVWAEQIASGEIRYYRLPAGRRGGGRLIGLFDRVGFLAVESGS